MTERVRRDRTGLALAGVAALALGAVVAAGAPARAQGLELESELLAAGLSRPTVVTHAGDGSGRVFLVRQADRKSVV